MNNLRKRCEQLVNEKYLLNVDESPIIVAELEVFAREIRNQALDEAAALFDGNGSYDREQTFYGGVDDDVSLTYRVGDILAENIRALKFKENS